MEEPELQSRRALFTRAAALGSAGVAGAVFGSLLGNGGTADADTSHWVGGILKSVTQEGLVLEGRQGWTLVQVSEDTALIRDRPANIQDFKIGDSLCARGDWAGTTFKATAVMPQYRPVSFKVQARAGRSLSTTSGRLLVTEDTAAVPNSQNQSISLTGLKPGASYGGFIRPEAHSGASVLFMVWPE
jgi:hypothetical protein